MQHPVKHLPPNLEGRDFVIGDLHGSFSCLVNLLAGVEFNPNVDRVISVGDLVDRGPDSLNCLELLREPWFHAVLSNHEQMMLDAFDGGYTGAFWLQNGGRWGEEALNDRKKHQRSLSPDADPILPAVESTKLWDLLPLVRELPFLITIDMVDGKKFHVIHAELPPGMPFQITDDVLADPVKVRELATVQTDLGDFITWGRHLYYQFNYDQLLAPKVKRTVAYTMKSSSNNIFNDQLSHIISGHTIVQQPLTILGQTNIDTCAFDSYSIQPRLWAKLTAVELKSWTFYQATEDKFTTTVPMTVNRADIMEI